VGVAGRSRNAWMAATVLGIVGALTIPALFGAGLLFHDQCDLTTSVGTEALWTPALVVNAPPNGTATGWANGSVLGPSSGNEVSVANGSAGVLEVEMSWTVYRTGMAWTLGPGLPDPCTVSLQPMLSGLAAGGSTLNACLLQGPGGASDENVSATTPVRGCAFLGTNVSAEVNDSFAVSCPSGSAFDTDCGSFVLEQGQRGSLWSARSSVGFPLRIPVPGTFPTSWLSADDPVNQTVIYSLPGPGCWIEEPMRGSPAELPSGLLVWAPSATFHETAPPDSSCPFV
jgi:hypothetical protein